MKILRLLIIWLLLVLVAPITIYFHGGISLESLAFLGVIYLFVALILWKELPFKKGGRVALVAGGFIGGIITIFLMILATMVLPGSKEHNHVMYDICLPAMRKYYGIKEGEGFPMSPVDKEGNSKWWYQHIECEQNVYDGKEPTFLENPPEFHPVK